MGALNKQKRSHTKTKPSLPLIVASALLLTSCDAIGSNSSIQTPRAIPEASFSNNPSSTSTQAASKRLAGEKLAISCSDVLSPTALYDLNPNLAAIEEQFSDAETPGILARELNGISCDYENLSGGAKIEVSIVKLKFESVDSLSTTLTGIGNSVPLEIQGISCKVYFSTVGTRGVTQALCGQNWIIVDSEESSNANDSYPFLIPAIVATGK